MPHLAILFDDGSVYDLSLEKKVSPSKEWILKLPKKDQYHGYSDQRGILYFVDGELKSPVIKYHKSINQEGHEIIPFNINNVKSRLGILGPIGMVFRCSVSVGNHFWLFGSTNIEHPIWIINTFTTNVETAIWYKKKEKFGSGPDLPNFMTQNFVDKTQKFCSTSLNSTHLMMFGFFNKSNEGYTRVAIVDFYNQIWNDWNPLPFEYDKLFQNCHASVVFDKAENAKIWLLIEKSIQEFDESEVQLMSFALCNGDDWKMEKSQMIGERILSMLSNS